MALFFIRLSSLKQILQNETWNMYLRYTQQQQHWYWFDYQPLMYGAIFHPLKIVSVFYCYSQCWSHSLLLFRAAARHCVQHGNESRRSRKRNRSHQMSFTRKLYSFYNSHNFNLFCHPNGVIRSVTFLMCFYATTAAAAADIKPTIFHAANLIYTHSILCCFFFCASNVEIPNSLEILILFAILLRK